jgi:prepilin-type N-terminal cleavage/methylation domain-containing protein
MQTYQYNGFTIVELLVVIVVIGILASITIVSYSGIANQATVASIKSDLDNSSKIIKMYETVYSSYPTLDANLCPSSPVVDNDYCLKPSANTTYQYSFDNTANSKGFCVHAEKSLISYKMTNDTIPSTGDCTDFGLVAYYNFDEGTGTNLSDSIGAFDGTWQGTLGSQWSAGRIGPYSGSFDNSTNYISVNNPLNEYSNISISAWVNVTSSSPWKTIVSTQSYQLAINGPTSIIWRWRDNSTSGYFQGSGFTLGQWKYLTVTKNGSSAAFYIDGALQSSTGTVSLSRSAANLNIGRDGLTGVGGLDYMDGDIDELRIYNRTLTSEEVGYLYDSNS